MKLGLSSYSLYQAMQSGQLTMLQAIEWAADHGAEHIEIVPLGFDLNKNPELIDEIRQTAEAKGIEISNYAIGANFITDDEAAYEAEIARVIKEVDNAAALGVKLMRHDVASRSDISINNFNADLPKLADACRRIADHAAQYGITTSVENHGYYIQNADRVQALVHAVDRPNYRTTLDIGNFMCSDEDSVVATKKNIGIASMVHIKDFYLRPAGQNPGRGWFTTSSGNYLRGAIAGHGDIKMRDVLRAVKQSGYDGYLSLEFEGMEECRQASEIGLENIRRIWDEV
ncbi:sugar phosphate isomerase/epimerase family protein [Paenibacillus guangzhouensis]|uniref:sugar phosphate isomerase/epimerase family protein n=1 Tax=Paenibacillus guangzhouensis TaxID=1473112 RepID=UPI0012673BBE|nr:sugar phosphate isomerase/epimerase family protein [Paenibacillus guangzhouensis]